MHSINADFRLIMKTNTDKPVLCRKDRHPEAGALMFSLPGPTEDSSTIAPQLSSLVLLPLAVKTTDLI